ncbi:MAG: NAD-dependent epimerase/dehydratase family protein, partial [Candidatus Cryptobacteroides sp.]
MDDKIYLVTGAAGFLGSNVCRQLVKRGCRVRAFALPEDKGIRYIPKEVEVCTGDLRDMDSLKRFFDVPPEMEMTVLHCASIVTVNPEFNWTVLDVNVRGTENIIACCRNAPGFRKLVYVSSTGCIPELPKGQAIKEVDRFSPSGLADCYSQSKALASQAVLNAAADGLDACIVHPGGIMGPEDYAVGHTTRTLIQIIKGEMGAGISGSFNLCDVRDLADGIIAASEKGRK